MIQDITCANHLQMSDTEDATKLELYAMFLYHLISYIM